MKMCSSFKRIESEEKNMLTTDEKARTRDIEKLRFLAHANGSYVEVLTTQMMGLRIRTTDTFCRPSLFPSRVAVLCIELLPCLSIIK